MRSKLIINYELTEITCFNFCSIYSVLKFRLPSPLGDNLYMLANQKISVKTFFKNFSFFFRIFKDFFLFRKNHNILCFLSIQRHYFLIIFDLFYRFATSFSCPKALIGEKNDFRSTKFAKPCRTAALRTHYHYIFAHMCIRVCARESEERGREEEVGNRKTEARRYK